MFKDHDETSPSIAAVSAPSVASSMLTVQQQKRLCRQFNANLSRSNTSSDNNNNNKDTWQNGHAGKHHPLKCQSRAQSAANQTISNLTSSIITQSQKQCLFYHMVGQLKLDTGTVNNKSTQHIKHFYNVHHGIQIVRY